MYHLTQNDMAVLIICLLTLALIGGIVSMIYILKYQEAKKQCETDSGLLARNLQRIIQLDTETTITKESVIKLIAEKKELKNAFEDAIFEIAELRIENKNEKEQLTYWKERALHIKHTKKQVGVELLSDWWECLDSHVYMQFDKYMKYKQDKTTISSSNDLIWLFENENHLHPYLVEKKYFKPCKNPNM